MLFFYMILRLRWIGLKRMKHTVQIVVDKNLCIGCGTCYSACPLEAITLMKNEIFKPSIDWGKCNDCGLCERSCPGYHVDYKSPASKKKREGKYSPLVGRYTNVYLGHAKDRYVRHMGSSGGVITAVLMYALENRIIDGALVVRTNGLNPIVTVAKSSAELKQAMGSKYIPVPLNTGLREIVSTDGHFAFVGLPCHLLGLSRIALIYPLLARKITLKLGLFCGRGFDYHNINYVLRDLGINPTRVRKIQFRGYGWPGKIFIDYISERASKQIYISYRKFGEYAGGGLFMPKRCVFCPDLTAELADVSFGDAWLQEIKESDTEGTSILIARNAWGNKIISEASQTGFISISKSSAADVVRSQSLGLYSHKITFATRLRVARILRVEAPLVDIEIIDKRSIFTLLSSTLDVLTQIVYRILKSFGFSELIPKPVVRIWDILHMSLSQAGSRLAFRDLKAI